MSDTGHNWNKRSEVAQAHFEITPSDTVDISKGFCVVYAGSAGTITAVDTAGTAITYTLVAGQQVPVLVRRVNATGTSVDPVIGLF